MPLDAEAGYTNIAVRMKMIVVMITLILSIIAPFIKLIESLL